MRALKRSGPRWKLSWPASDIPVDHPITQAIASAHTQAAEGQTRFDPAPNFQGFAAVCDAAFLNIEGIPAVVYGPGNLLVAHAMNEYVEIEEVIQSTKAFAIAAMDWCGVAS